MSLAGNLKTVSFADILQLLTTGHKTGILHVETGGQGKDIAFKDGDIIFASSTNVNDDMLGSLLLKRGRLSKENLERAIVLHKQSGRPLGATLVDMKVFTPEDVAECLQMQVEEIVYNLFSWPEGTFEFREGVEPVGAPFLLQLSSMAVMMEGSRRIDEWVEIQKALPKDDVLLRLSYVNSAVDTEENCSVTLTLDEFRLLPFINGERTTPQIIEISPIGEFPSYRALYKLIVAGYIESAGSSHGASITGIAREEEAVLHVVFYLYNSCLSKIRSSVIEIFGEGSPACVRFFEMSEAAGRSSILARIPTEKQDQSDSASFDIFYASVVKIPAPIRLHTLMTALESYLADQLELVFRFLGAAKYRSAVHCVKKEISEPLATRRELVKRYHIDENFYAALKRADRVVKTAMRS